MTETEAENAFETEDMLIISPQAKLTDIDFKGSNYKNAQTSKLKRYISRDVKPLTKKETHEILFS